MFSRPLAMLLVSVGLIAAALAPSVASARPPGHDVSSSGCSTPTLVGPASATIGESYTVTGCGFAARSMVNLEITEGGGCCRAQQIYTGETGEFSLTSSVWAPGVYRVRASVSRRKGWTVVASWSFEAA